jgi:hypothetical protein
MNKLRNFISDKFQMYGKAESWHREAVLPHCQDHGISSSIVFPIQRFPISPSLWEIPPFLSVHWMFSTVFSERSFWNGCP